MGNSIIYYMITYMSIIIYLFQVFLNRLPNLGFYLDKFVIWFLVTFSLKKIMHRRISF